MVHLLLPICASIFSASAVAILLESRMGSSAVLKQRLSHVKGMYRRERKQLSNDKQSFSERIVKPISDEIVQRIAIALPLNADSRERLDKQLSMAGSSMKANEFAAITLLTVICMAVLAPLSAIFLFEIRDYTILFSLGGAYIGYFLRRYSLTSAFNKRRQMVESQLPNIIDLLSVSVTAGLGFEQALAYVTERCEGAFVDELKTMQQQLLMGRSRRDAMRALSERCCVDEVATFVSSVLQADEVGISMQSILNSQAASIRMAHKQKIEEKAAKLPVKILLPIVGLIFPVIFIVLMGPVVPSLMDSLGG